MFSSHLGWAEGTLMFWRLPPLPLYWSHLLSTKHGKYTYITGVQSKATVITELK